MQVAAGTESIKCSRARVTLMDRTVDQKNPDENGASVEAEPGFAPALLGSCPCSMTALFGPLPGWFTIRNSR